MKKVLILMMTLGLVSVFAAETAQPAPQQSAPKEPTKVEKTVVKVEKVEKKAEGQVKKEVKRDANKM